MPSLTVSSHCADDLWRLFRCYRARPEEDRRYVVYRVVAPITAHSQLFVGISSYDVSLEKQEVLVKGTIGYDDLLEKIKKTGKEVSCATVVAAPLAGS